MPASDAASPTPDGDVPAIEVSGLRKRYGRLEALRGVDLTIERGGIVGLLGPNGAGKTTLVETLEGLRRPTEGRVRVFGLDPGRQASRLKERIGVQLQSTAFPELLTVEEILRLFASFYPGETSVRRALEIVELEEAARRRAGDLSGGQRQRLALAMALVHDPDLLILDEPTSGLDPAARRRLHATLEGLRAAGRTVLLTTHYVEEAEKLCERVLMIRSGEIVADGTPFALVDRARRTSTLWLAAEGSFDPAPLVEAGAEPRGEEDGYLRFATSRPARVVSALGRALREQDVTLTDLRLRRPTLEDVYMEVMGEELEEAERPPAAGPRRGGAPPGGTPDGTGPEELAREGAADGGRTPAPDGSAGEA